MMMFSCFRFSIFVREILFNLCHFTASQVATNLLSLLFLSLLDLGYTPIFVSTFLYFHFRLRRQFVSIFSYISILEFQLVFYGISMFNYQVFFLLKCGVNFLFVYTGNKGAGRTPLTWEIRSTIALGTARGIEYLHSQGPNISHGNIKSSNILLTKSYEARVSDFGLAHLVGPSSTPNRVAGYRAPEVTDPRKVSQKADVYSFGVLLLELLTGKAPTHALLNEEGVDLPRWVQSIVREEWTSEVFDLELLRYQNVEEEMVQLLQLAIDCAAQYPDKRPSMSEVTVRIEELCRSSVRDFQDPQPDFVDETA